MNPIRFLRRLRLALRYYHRLGFSWRLAWIRAGR
jgi:hypothetical protein